MVTSKLGNQAYGHCAGITVGNSVGTSVGTTRRWSDDNMLAAGGFSPTRVG